jgi:hypothetical protein
MTKEEAIDNVRSFIGQLTAECQESIHTLIPELAESEDEKVRKALIDGIRQIRCKNGVTQEQMLAWLEKQKPAKWSEEDENMLTGIIERGSSQIPFGELALRKEQLEWLMDRFKFLHFQSRDYAITFWTYLDEHRPEGKMCLSNGECADIEKAFIEHDWAKILRYAKKYRPSWKPSKEQMEALENSTALTEKQGEALYSLVQDLKKL